MRTDHMDVTNFLSSHKLQSLITHEVLSTVLTPLWFLAIPLQSLLLSKSSFLIRPKIDMSHASDSGMSSKVENNRGLSSSFDIDPSGDILIYLQEDMILRISSKVLAIASKVFSAMFQKGFQVGNILAETGSGIVELPDDDPKAIHALCLLLHHHHPLSIPYVVDAEFLHRMAIVVDKYACADAVYGWAMHQVSDLASNP